MLLGLEHGEGLHQLRLRVGRCKIVRVVFSVVCTPEYFSRALVAICARRRAHPVDCRRSVRDNRIEQRLHVIVIGA